MQAPPSARRERFESLLQPVLALAYSTAFHLTRSREEAEDLLGEATLRAFRSFHTFDQQASFKPWFMRVLTNLFYEKCRERKRRPRTVSVEEAPEAFLFFRTMEAGLHGGGEDPAAVVLDRLGEEQVARALQDLPEEHRVVAVLHFLEQLSYAEIAAAVGIPVGTVRSRLHRGRRMLQKALWRIAAEEGIVAREEGRP